MDIDNLKNIIRIGYVSSVDAGTGTARVSFPDSENIVSSPLQIVSRGTKNTKDFWLPAIDDQVLCIMMPDDSGKGTTDGYIIGSLYSAIDKPPEQADSSMRVLDHHGNMVINCSGKLTINAPDINITGGSGDAVINGISLVNHLHDGVKGGSDKTGKPQ